MEQKFEASMAIQLLPKMEQKSMLNVIDKVIKHIQSKGFNIIVCPFETVVEGGFNDIMELLKECLILANKEGAKDLLAYIKIAYNSEGVLSIDEKISKYN